MNFYGLVTSSRHCGQDLRACPTCGKETFHTLHRRRAWFTLFFLPVVPLGRDRASACCNLCGQENVEGGHSAVMSNVQAGTKTCPDCAELIRREARLCRYCRRRFSEEEITAAQEFAEAAAAELAERMTRQILLRKAGVCSVLSWILIPPGSLLSILVAVLIISTLTKREEQDNVVVLVVVWVILTIPFFLGLLMRRKARRIRKSIEDPPAETEEDVWKSSLHGE